MAATYANSPYRILRVSVTGSTNADLLAKAREGESAGLVLVADHQTAGRGRLDRTWVAPVGVNLLCSVLLRPTVAPAQWFRYPMALALAVADTCTTLGIGAQVKWPNDVLIGDEKFAGILAEVERDALIIGLGANVGWPAMGEYPGATSLRANGVTIDPVTFAALVFETFAPDAADLFDRYRAASATIGRDVTVELPGGTLVTGTAVGVDDEGLLVLQVPQAASSSGPAFVTKKFAVGDVIHARRAR